MIATLFVNPMLISTDNILWLLIPLCIAVAIVYKTVRTESLRRLPLEILILIVLMVLGLVSLGVSLTLIVDYWP